MAPRTSSTSSSILSITSDARSQSNPTDAARLPNSYARSRPGSVFGTPPSVVFAGPPVAARSSRFSSSHGPAPPRPDCARVGLAEHVRVPAHELVGDRLDRVGDREVARSSAICARNTTSKSRSPSSSRRSAGSPPIDRVEHLVGLLEHERPQRLERLLAIPRAAARRRAACRMMSTSWVKRSPGVCMGLSAAVG